MNQSKVEISKGLFVEYKECQEIDEWCLELTTQAQEINTRVKIEIWIDPEAWSKLKKYVENVVENNIKEAKDNNTFYTK